MRRCLLASLSIAIANAAFGHPGHGSSESVGSQSLWHFVSEPVHLLPLVTVVASTLLAVKLGRRFHAAMVSNEPSPRTALSEAESSSTLS
jgi:hypothetical protein